MAAGEDEGVGERERRLYEVVGGYYAALAAGRAPALEDLRAAHPDLADDLDRFFDEQDRFHRVTEPLRLVASPPRDEADPTVRLDGGGGQNPPAAVDARTWPHDEAGAYDAATRVRQFGDFELVEEIARGGMGVVFKARQRSLNRPVALKMMLSGRFASRDDLRRFRNEAEAVANLDHPNIVPVYEVGEHEGFAYIAMKLVEGESLAVRLTDFADDTRAAALLVSVVARAVHHAHQRGVLHRDLKPSNILLDADGRPHVTDFGLARRVEGEPGLTRSGELLGSPPYMAAEQASGRKGSVTTATDVYGLGAVLYAALTARPPFQAGSVVETLDQVRGRLPDPPGGINRRVDRDLRTVCLKCLEKEPSRRYASALELADDLDRWLRGEPIAARPVTRAERAWRWCRRNPVVAGLSGLVLLLTLAGVGVLAASNRMILRRNAEITRKNAEAVRQREKIKQALDGSERSRAQAEEVKKLLVASFLKPDPGRDGREVKAVEVLD